MNAMSIARKELKALFQSSVAVLFLGVFLVVTLFTFFGSAAFFARNLADVRPLFEWLPLLLVFLVSAVTMRMWAEERRAGTLEVLLTLPVRTRDLVLGKFLAGLALVALALALTLPLPLIVSTLGPLDWGPVVGGYTGALLLGGLYVAVGLCVSSRTDNQVVSLMTTLVIGGLAWLIGSDAVVAALPADTAELLRNLGTGSRFRSIERGVLDLRDLVYYGSATAFFLLLNVAFLEHGRLDVGSERGRARSRALVTLVLLGGLNVVAANLWLAPLTGLRWDLTENREHSVSPVTRQLLQRLDEPLVIEGFFSERTHPLLAPLIPQIRDMLAEYDVHGGDRVRVSFTDPSTDEDLETEIGEQYGIRSFPFGVADRHSQGVVNSYFHLLVRYGDAYEVLTFEDLIELREEETGLSVRLRNLEYDLTRTIHKVTQQFRSLDATLAALPDQAKLTAYVTPDQLPSDFADAAEVMRKVGSDLASRSGGRLSFEEVDPSGDASLRERLWDEYGVRPLAVDLFGDRVFYLHLVLEAGDEIQRIMPRPGLTEGDLERALEAVLERATPGRLTTVALYTEHPTAPPPNPQIPPQFQPPPPQPDYRLLQRLLREGYEVVSARLDEGWVPDEVDVLVLGKVGSLTDEQRFAIDQFLMRGGSVVALAGSWRVEPDAEGLSAVRESGDLNEMLAHYGVQVGDRFVMDPRNAPFPIPVQERRGAFTLQRIELLPYPFFPDVRAGGRKRDHVALAGLNSVTVPWASPLELPEEPVEGRTYEVLLESSGDSWLQTGGRIEPDFSRWPGEGFGPQGERRSHVLAAAVTGRFDSWFADRPNPLFSDEEHDGSGRTLTESVTDGRLVVIGSSEIVSDLLVGLANQFQGEVHRNNIQLLANLVDWSVEDTELLSIRSSGAFARTLDPLTDDERASIEFVTYALVLVPLVLIVGLPRARRRRVQPLALPAAMEEQA